MPDVWTALRAETVDLAERLAELSRDQWDSASLCSDWHVRDVLAHVTAGATGAFRTRAIVGGMLRHGLDYNRWIAVDGQQRGRLDPTLILQAFRDTAGASRPAGRGAAVRALTHVVVHGQDICRPLDIKRAMPEAHLVIVANFVASSFIFRAKKHIAGLRLIATDLEWSHGSGPEVSGPGEALVMMMAGRSIALEDLSGEGMTTLREAVAVR